MMKRSGVVVALASLLVAVCVGLFQNCSDVRLEKPALEQALTVAAGTVTLCLEGPYSSMTLDSALALNLNVVPKSSTIEIDSDGDGVSDADERTYGYDPMKRRTFGTFLDRICLDASGADHCQGLTSTCSKMPNKFGLSDCDVQVLGLDRLYGHPDQGLDSDKDGLADLVEILRGTNPAQADSLADPDHDLKRNIDEIGRGSNVAFAESEFVSKYKVVATSTKLAASSSCAGELWVLNVESLPWTPLPAFTDDMDSNLPVGALSMTRPERTNTGVLVLKLGPKPGSAAKAKLLFRPLILGEDLVNLDGTIDDFIQAGEVEP